MKLKTQVTRDQLDRLVASLQPVVRADVETDAFEDALIHFIWDVHASKFIVPYDWIRDVAGRQEEARSAVALQSMDADTFRRTVIAHVRADRFVRGHLKKLATSAYLTAVIERATQLRATL